MNAAKKRFIFSIVLLVAGIVYAVYPLDIIPDILGPIGWVEDIGLLLASALYAAYSYRRHKKAETVLKDGQKHQQ
ncbi:DUF1232 domain-containing protein [Thermodesulfobacteriota bacterium]